MNDHPDSQVPEGTQTPMQSYAPKYERRSDSSTHQDATDAVIATEIDERPPQPRQTSLDRSCGGTLPHPPFPVKPSITQKGIVLTPSPCPHEALFERHSTGIESEHRLRANVETTNPIVNTVEATVGGQAEKHYEKPKIISGQVHSNGTTIYRANVASNSAMPHGDEGKSDLVKATQEEARVEEDLLKSKIRELECLLVMQKQAEKEESLALSSQVASVKYEHKQGLAFITARAKHESALSDLRTKEATLLVSRNRTHHQNELVMQKEKEIEELRQRKAVDDRQRQGKMKGFKRLRH